MLEPDGPLVNLGKKRKDGNWNFKLWHREDETAPLEVRWASTGPSTGLDSNSGSRAEKSKSTGPVGPVIRRTSGTGLAVPPPELPEEPPDGDGIPW
jgi:hypothetical protein